MHEQSGGTQGFGVGPSKFETGMVGAEHATVSENPSPVPTLWYGVAFYENPFNET